MTGFVCIENPPLDKALTIKDQQGFPWDQKELRYYGTYYGFPSTLKENAIRAHKYLFGTSDYQVSDELSRINQKIIYRAGY